MGHAKALVQGSMTGRLGALPGHSPAIDRWGDTVGTASGTSGFIDVGKIAGRAVSPGIPGPA